MKPFARELIQQRIKDSIAVKKTLLLNEELLASIARLAEALTTVIASGGRVLLCGNGGSASDALHIAGEIVGRFQKERSAWSAIVLNADVATMTAIANDYGYENVFARQVTAHVREGDLFIGFSTSGNSENILAAARTARELGGLTAALTGNQGGRLGAMVDFSIVVPSDVTARIQESHILIGHIICELVENNLGGVDRAVFLDRDGTINVDKAYVHKIADFEFLPGAIEALSLLRKAGYRLVIVTNQSGVARGCYSEDDVRALHVWLSETLAREGIDVAGIYYCPHHPEARVEAYRSECGCRKPGLALFYKAASELGLDVDRSIAIGDRARDLQICRHSGCRGYLVGDGETELPLPASVRRAASLLAAAKDIVVSAEG